MPLLIHRRTDCSPFLDGRATLTAPLAALLRLESVAGDPEISVVLCDDPFIQDLNASYRGLNKPTDVLSFAQDDPALLGDIVISLPTAARQASAAGWLLENEIALLGIHGLLHLLGHDDETEAGAWEMQAKTEAALRECGIAVPEAGTHPFFVEASGLEKSASVGAEGEAEEGGGTRPYEEAPCRGAGSPALLSRVCFL